MRSTVSVKSSIIESNSLGSSVIKFELPLTDLIEVRGQYSVKYNVLITTNTEKIFDLSNISSNLIMLAIKSSRPVTSIISTADKDYELPRATYNCLLTDTKENSQLLATSLKIIVPAAAVTAPSPAPANYPNCEVEIYALLRSIA
jgi:hypothetical protein